MTSRNIDEAAADIDDATTSIEELQAEPNVNAPDKLKEVHEALDHASDVLDDEVEDDDEEEDDEDEDEGEGEGEGEDSDSPELRSMITRRLLTVVFDVHLVEQTPILRRGDG